MAVSWLFVDPSFHENKGKRVLEMLDDIKQAFASMVSRTDWMDQRTKMATLEKNENMISQIGFPDWLFDETVLNEYYEGVRDSRDSQVSPSPRDFAPRNETNLHVFQIDLSETEYLNNMIRIVRLMSLSELECIHEINYNNVS